MPYLVYRSLRLTMNVPGFIQQSFSYYSLQIITYIMFFSIRMVFSFILQMVSISVRIQSDDKPQMLNIDIRDLDLLLRTIDLLVLATLISMDELRFSKFLHKCMPSCLMKSDQL